VVEAAHLAVSIPQASRAASRAVCSAARRLVVGSHFRGCVHLLGRKQHDGLDSRGVGAVDAQRQRGGGLVAGELCGRVHVCIAEREVEALQLATDRRDERLDRDRKSTRLNSSHGSISYAVFCLKKKKRTKT